MASPSDVGNAGGMAYPRLTGMAGGIPAIGWSMGVPKADMRLGIAYPWLKVWLTQGWRYGLGLPKARGMAYPRLEVWLTEGWRYIWLTQGWRYLSGLSFFVSRKEHSSGSW